MAQPDATPGATFGLSTQQRRALEGMLEGMTTTQVAELVGVHRSTVWRWLTLPEFAGALRDAESVQIGEIMRALGSAGHSAVATLLAVKDDPDSPAGVRVRAASDLLARLLPMRELIALEDRMAAVEQALEERQAR